MLRDNLVCDLKNIIDGEIAGDEEWVTGIEQIYVELEKSKYLIRFNLYHGMNRYQVPIPCAEITVFNPKGDLVLDEELFSCDADVYHIEEIIKKVERYAKENS